MIQTILLFYCLNVGTYHAQAVRTPSLSYVKEIAGRLNFDLSHDEIKEYHGIPYILFE